MATLLGERFALVDEALSDLKAAAILHEIGAISTPDGVLLKSRASADEAMLAQLSGYGSQVLTCVPELRNIADIIYYQRENFDGTGCPFGLLGDQIPIGSRIIRLASEYDLLRNPRNAPIGLDHATAVEQLKRQSCKQFDPEVVQALVALSNEELETLQHLSAMPERPELITCAIN